MNQPATDAAAAQSAEDQHIVRQRKLDQIWTSRQPYPNTFRRTALTQDLRERYDDKSAEELKGNTEQVQVAGRIMAMRKMGKVAFADLTDSSGKVQLFVKRDIVSEPEFERFALIDIGDIVGAKGRVFRTRTGELSLEICEFELLSKALRPFPEKFHGLKDTETRYRQRYLDLTINEEVREIFHMRARITSAIRQFMESHDFIEVETPMMHIVPGGAIARPFVTHHNALSLDMYLRVAPELNLKRLVVGGMERVYEINRNFRNEGVSTQHNPEFTMLEFYQAFADYQDLIRLTEEMFETLCANLLAGSTIEFQEHQLNLAPPFAKIKFEDAVRKFNPELSKADLRDDTQTRPYLAKLGGSSTPSWGAGKVLFEIFERTVEDRLIEPTFITHYPLEVSPLSRVSDDDPWIVDRFEFFMAGIEIANGFSELNDPADQAERFRAQLEQRQLGDEEAMAFDEDYIRALEYGLPPTAGEGIGIDRLVMLLTNSPSIRDVVLFPHMKPMGQ